MVGLGEVSGGMKYLYSSVPLYFSSTTCEGQIMYILLHYICLTALVKTYFSDLHFVIPFLSNENHVSPNLLILNVNPLQVENIILLLNLNNLNVIILI